MAKTIISDTADVTFKRRRDGKVIFTAEAQLASITQSISEEKLKGGIGNRTIAVLRSDKEVELQVRNAIFDSEWLEMSSGVSFAQGTAVVTGIETDLVASSVPDLTLTGTVKTGTTTVTVIKADGTTATGAYASATKKVTVSTPVGFLVAGQVYSVQYDKEVTGNMLTLQSDKFSEAYSVEYRTIEYDISTNAIKNDLYFVFNSVTPSGNWSLSFENGQAITPELNFTVLTLPGSKEIGRIIEVPRV